MPIYGSNSLRMALVRPLPNSFLNALTQNSPIVPIDWVKAQAQHEHYVALLRKHLPRLIEIPVDENHPDCCFIEDTALAIDNRIIIARIGADSRRDESLAVAEAFQSLKQAGEAIRIDYLEAPATLDGGDVLQMGDHVFVGLSKRSNRAAVEQLQKFLPEKTVVAIPVSDGLHLKSVLSAGDDRTLIAGDIPQARPMADAILRALPKNSRCVWVPDTIAANVLRLGQTILVQSGFARSEAILKAWAEEWGGQVESLNMSELIKADGALTCCSILVGY